MCWGWNRKWEQMTKWKTEGGDGQSVGRRWEFNLRWQGQPVDHTKAASRPGWAREIGLWGSEREHLSSIFALLIFYQDSASSVTGPELSFVLIGINEVYFDFVMMKHIYSCAKSEKSEICINLCSAHNSPVKTHPHSTFVPLQCTLMSIVQGWFLQASF